jgi:hypothetical protein
MRYILMLALVLVGMLAADQAISEALRDDTTPCREAPKVRRDWGSHTHLTFQLAEACRQEWRRAHGTYIIPDSYRGPSKDNIGRGSWK